MLTDVERQIIMKKAIIQNGLILQQSVAMEELAELIKEISKFIRGKGKRDSLIEEIADSLIMIEQIKLIHKITNKEIEDEVNFKLVRLNDRLNNDDNQ